MTLALVILATSLASVVWLVGHMQHERRKTRAVHQAAGAELITIQARRPRRRAF